MSRHRFRITLAFLVALLIAAALGYRELGIPGFAAPAPEPSAPAGPMQPPPGVPVETAQIATGRVVDAIEAVGTIRSNEAVVIVPEIAGRITRIGFKEGDRVKAGAPLVQLEDTILKAELAQARSQLQLTEANYQRIKTLADRGTATGRSRDEALAALQTARAAVALAEGKLDRTVIRAPFDGVLGLRSVSLGGFVNPGDRIVNLEDLDPLKIDFRVPEVYLTAVRDGQPVEITVDALPGQTFRGEIYARNPVVDASGRSIELRARVPNADGRLSPGLFARVRVITDERPDALIVPEAAIVPDRHEKFVYRVIDGRAVRTPVTLGARLPGRVEIVDGLDAGAVVVTAGQQKLRDGAPVAVQTAQAGS